MRKIYGELKKNDINNNLESKNNQIISNENNINNNDNDNKEKLFKKNEPNDLESIINENVNLKIIDNGNGNKTNTSNIPFKAKKGYFNFWSYNDFIRTYQFIEKTRFSEYIRWDICFIMFYFRIFHSN